MKGLNMKKILLKYYYIILDGIGYIKYLYSKIYFNKNYKNINKEIDINKIKKVLFVTHPDDEINVAGQVIVDFLKGDNKK